MAILKDTLINGACRVIGDAYFNSIIHGRSDYATRLHRRDDPSDYSVQTDWTGTYWRLRGYSGDTYHAGCLVAYADNSGTVGGLAVHSGRNNEANKIVRTDSNGYLLCGYINSSSGNENNNSSPDRVWGSNSSDSYLRTYRTSALSVGYATYCNSVYGRYTTNGGQQAPNYFGTNRVGFLMMNTPVNGNSNYKDWVIMDCYSGNDVGGGVAIGVDRQALGAFIMRSEYRRTSWSLRAELLGTHNYSSYAVAKSGSTMTGALTVPSLTVTGASSFSQAINASILGNAATASRLLNARTISLSGNASGSASFDGSGNITISTTVSQATNADKVGNEYASAFAHRAAANNLVHAGNEITMIPDSYNNTLWFNYLSVSRNSSSTITEYEFGDGKQGYAPVKANGFVKNGSDSSHLLLGNGGHKAVSDFATASSVYSILNVDGSNEPQANNIKYYSVTDLYPSTETLGVQYLITCSDTESYIISFGTSRSDSSQIYCDIVALNIQYTLDEFKFSNRTLYFKHDARSDSKYYDIQIKLISGPKKSPSKSLITETAYNNIGSSYIKTAGYIYNSNNSSCYMRHNLTSTAYYYRIVGLMSDDISGPADSLHLYTISCREGFYLLLCGMDQINLYTIKAGGISGFKYVRGYYTGDSPHGLYLYINSESSSTFTGITTIRQIGGLPGKLTVEEISSSTYNGLSGAVTTNESRTFYHTGNLNPQNYTMHYDTVSDNSGGILYIPDNVDGPNYFVHTIESSNSTTYFYYMLLDGLPNWTCYYNYMRHQLIVNKKTVDITVLMNLGHSYSAPATSFVVPAGYSIELSIYLHSQTDPIMITWSSPLRSPS